MGKGARGKGWVPEPLPPHRAFLLRGVGQFSLAKEKRPTKHQRCASMRCEQELDRLCNSI